MSTAETVSAMAKKIKEHCEEMQRMICLKEWPHAGGCGAFEVHLSASSAEGAAPSLGAPTVNFLDPRTLNTDRNTTLDRNVNLFLA